MGNALVALCKFILAVFLAPIVVAGATSFQSHLAVYPDNYQALFLWGMVAFLLMFLFLSPFGGIYAFGEKVVMTIFKFLAPLDKVLAYCIPIYFVLTLLVCYAVKLWFKIDSHQDYFIFFAGFTVALHILLAAQNLQKEEKTPVKPAYLFLMSIFFIINLCVVVLLLDLFAGHFTFPQFIKSLVDESMRIYAAAAQKLFP